MSTNIEKRLNDIRHKIQQVKENRNNHYRCPKDILYVLYKTELKLEDYLFELKAKTEFNF